MRSQPSATLSRPAATLVPKRLRPVLLLLLASGVVAAATASQPHVYKSGDAIPTFVNKVGPYFNTHETYHYYSLPICRPEKIVSRSLTLGEVLDGDRMAVALHDIKFRQDKPPTPLCTAPLSPKDVNQLRDAIEDLYYFEFVIDDLPVRGFIGQLEQQMLPHTLRVFLWTHMHFVMEYHGSQVVRVAVAEKTKEVELPESTDTSQTTMNVEFTYSVEWKENTKIPFTKRATHDKTFFPRSLEIHWLSVINSAVLVGLLMTFVAVILTRALNKDFARYAREEEDFEDEISEDQGWKMIHTDVFRFPPYMMVFCAVIGNGVQFLTLASCIILMALFGMFNVHRHGSINTAAILTYALTSFVSGYTSTRFYRQLGGQRWAWNVLCTSGLFTLPFFVIWSTINSFAWAQGSTQALPATTIVLLVLVWLLAGLPLTVVGGAMGRKTTGDFEAPCRTKNIAREIPNIPWYRGTIVQLFAGGFIPFSAISVELYYVFATVWGREHYALYGILMLVFLIMIAVTICISIAITYYRLSNEDYRWWWPSVFTSGFSAAFVYAYAAFYFYARSNMTGTLQTVQFFGYTLIATYAFFLVLGTIGFGSSLIFVKYIYRNLKLD